MNTNIINENTRSAIIIAFYLVGCVSNGIVSSTLAGAAVAVVICLYDRWLLTDDFTDSFCWKKLWNLAIGLFVVSATIGVIAISYLRVMPGIAGYIAFLICIAVGLMSIFATWLSFRTTMLLGAIAVRKNRDESVRLSIQSDTD